MAPFERTSDFRESMCKETQEEAGRRVGTSHALQGLDCGMFDVDTCLTVDF